jgi:hypothetical protein
MIRIMGDCNKLVFAFSPPGSSASAASQSAAGKEAIGIVSLPPDRHCDQELEDAHWESLDTYFAGESHQQCVR